MTLRSLLPVAGALAVIGAAPAFAAPHALSPFISDYDQNGDGEVTRAEFDAVRAARFAATDTNGDGWVSDAEYLAEYEQRLDKRLARFEGSAEDRLSTRQREVRQTHVRFEFLDKDKNKQMSKAEYDASGAAAFERQDRNKDGKITAEDAPPPKADKGDKAAD